MMSFPLSSQTSKEARRLEKRGGKPMLNMLNLDYFRAGLNCGNCHVITTGKLTNYAEA
jgi:hypothetical protein